MYPPFSRMARLLVRGRAEERVVASINALKTALDGAIRERGASVRVMGPSSAPFGKIGGNYRHHIILKSDDVASLREVIVAARGAVSGRDVYLEIDIDPYELL